LSYDVHLLNVDCFNDFYCQLVMTEKSLKQSTFSK